MKFCPEEANYKYDKDFFIGGKPYDLFAHCESQDIFRRQVEMVEDVIGCFEGKTILDVGGALGWLAKRCQDKGADAYCQDISEWACAHSPIPDYMRCGDVGKRILFDDNTFDIVISFETFEHIVNIKNAINEIGRVLKLGGILFATVATGEAPSHVHIGTLNEWEDLINANHQLQIDNELTNKIRHHEYCLVQRWKTIISRKLCG